MQDDTQQITLPTWGGHSQFSYRYNGGDLALQYGNNRRCRVSAKHMARLRADHRGQLVAVFGPAPSLDSWSREHITCTRIVSYLAPAMVALGLAERSGDRIKFV